MSDMLPSITDVIGNCSCGPSCACPGCLTHGNPPLPAQAYTQEESATCGCDEINVQELLKKSECGNLEEFLQKASSLVPFPPQGLSSSIDNYVDGKAFGLQSWQQLYDPRNKGITRLPPLETECCGGSCQCQAVGVECRCEESCCGCCTSCNCEVEASNESGGGRGEYGCLCYAMLKCTQKHNHHRHRLAWKYPRSTHQAAAALNRRTAVSCRPRRSQPPYLNPTASNSPSSWCRLPCLIIG